MFGVETLGMKDLFANREVINVIGVAILVERQKAIAADLHDTFRRSRQSHDQGLFQTG